MKIKCAVFPMDIQSPVTVAVATVVLTSVLCWAYAKYMLKDPNAEKTLAKTLVCGIASATIVVLYIRQYDPVPSLQADPFFAPVV